MVACSAPAAAAGVVRQMGVAAARAMVPALQVVPRRTSQEADALVRLACWAGRFTPRVAMAPPAALLLEIGGSLRLFGGLPALLDAIAGELESLGFAVQHAVAPTPQAALWCAGSAPGTSCCTSASLRGILDRLPLNVLADAAAHRLHGFGARTLGDVRRLPAAALTQRIGPEALQALARAYGDLPNPQVDFVFPARFSQGLELPSAVESAGALLFAARRLTAALAGWLAVRKAGIGQCFMHLLHRRGVTPLSLRFATATRDPLRLERVLRERLERHVLAAPVEGLRLEADTIADLPGDDAALFVRGGTTAQAMPALLERLVARLGESRVFRLAANADHRPERATTRAVAGTAPLAVALPPRPCWLLAAPRALHEVNGRPHYRGALMLLAGPERIESGWWDGALATRDYFIAAAADGTLAWIYRARLPLAADPQADGSALPTDPQEEGVPTPDRAAGWYLHGRFA